MTTYGDKVEAWIAQASPRKVEAMVECPKCFQWVREGFVAADGERRWRCDNGHGGAIL